MKRKGEREDVTDSTSGFQLHIPTATPPPPIASSVGFAPLLIAAHWKWTRFKPNQTMPAGDISPYCTARLPHCLGGSDPTLHPGVAALLQAGELFWGGLWEGCLRTLFEAVLLYWKHTNFPDLEEKSKRGLCCGLLLSHLTEGVWAPGPKTVHIFSIDRWYLFIMYFTQV